MHGPIILSHIRCDSVDDWRYPDPNYPHYYSLSFIRFNKQGFVTKLCRKTYTRPQGSIKKRKDEPIEVLTQDYSFPQNNTILVLTVIDDRKQNIMTSTTERYHYNERHIIDTITTIALSGRDSTKTTFSIDTVNGKIVARSRVDKVELLVLAYSFCADSLIPNDSMLNLFAIYSNDGDRKFMKYRKELFKNKPFTYLLNDSCYTKMPCFVFNDSVFVWEVNKLQRSTEKQKDGYIYTWNTDGTIREAKNYIYLTDDNSESGTHSEVDLAPSLLNRRGSPDLPSTVYYDCTIKKISGGFDIYRLGNLVKHIDHVYYKVKYY